MSEQPRIARCCRIDCQGTVEAVISLEVEGNERKTYSLCLYHYHESLAVIQGIKAMTGMPEARPTFTLAQLGMPLTEEQVWPRWKRQDES